MNIKSNFRWVSHVPVGSKNAQYFIISSEWSTKIRVFVDCEVPSFGPGDTAPSLIRIRFVKKSHNYTESETRKWKRAFFCTILFSVHRLHTRRALIFRLHGVKLLQYTTKDAPLQMSEVYKLMATTFYLFLLSRTKLLCLFKT